LEPAEPDSPTSRSHASPVVPDHKLIRLIGSGSSGQVWLAENTLGTYRAVKVVYERTFKHRRPFDREFNGILKTEPVSRLHAGLADILQVGRNESAGYFYCVMELADDARTGRIISPDNYIPRTLAHDVAVRNKLPVTECVGLGVQLASALGFLHRQGLVHQDIKPSNIIFVENCPKLADIGSVAAISEARAYVGTEGFIPPEGPGTIQADIYSLGKVLYEISTGKDRTSYPELPPSLDHTVQDRKLVEFNRIVLNACRNDLQQRYKSTDEMIQALLAFQSGAEDPRRERIRGRMTILITVAGALFGTGVLFFLLRRLIWLLKQGA
jgi:eukaryotic-like serine/threonine-protein kinase